MLPNIQYELRSFSLINHIEMFPNLIYTGNSISRYQYFIQRKYVFLSRHKHWHYCYYHNESLRYKYELGNHLFHAHCLRHTHGTILAEGGVNPKTVMERLGHKDITTTLQTYTFNTESMQQFAVEVFEKKIQA